MDVSVIRASSGKKNLFYSGVVFIAGSAFLIQELQIFLIALLIFNKPHKFLFPAQFKKSFIQTLYILSITFPVIIFTNYISSVLLNDFSLQYSVVTIQKENRVHLSTIFSLCLLSPLIEEIYFRGLLLNRIKLMIGPFWGILVSSFYFSIVHLNILASPTLFALGVILGLISLLTKSIFYSILLHATFNTTMLIMIL